MQIGDAYAREVVNLAGGSQVASSLDSMRKRAEEEAVIVISRKMKEKNSGWGKE